MIFRAQPLDFIKGDVRQSCVLVTMPASLIALTPPSPVGHPRRLDLPLGNLKRAGHDCYYIPQLRQRQVRGTTAREEAVPERRQGRRIIGPEGRSRGGVIERGVGDGVGRAYPVSAHSYLLWLLTGFLLRDAKHFARGCSRRRSGRGHEPFRNRRKSILLFADP